MSPTFIAFAVGVAWIGTGYFAWWSAWRWVYRSVYGRTPTYAENLDGMDVMMMGLSILCGPIMLVGYWGARFVDALSR